VVAHGGQGDEPVSRVAPAHPEIAFAITQGGWLAPNCASYEVLQEHSAFLGGYWQRSIRVPVSWPISRARKCVPV
jgi:basic membrane lipoprotein Med (substrate-binding protein (PBP1-ABC) superfamily)